LLLSSYVDGMGLFRKKTESPQVEWISRDPGPERAPGVPRGDGTYSSPGYQFAAMVAVHAPMEGVMQALLESPRMRLWMFGSAVKGPEPSPAELGSTYSVGLMTNSGNIHGGAETLHLHASSPDYVGTIVELTTTRLVRRYELEAGRLADSDRRQAEREVAYDFVESGGVTQVTCTVTAPMMEKWRRGLATTGASYIVSSYESSLARSLGWLKEVVESLPPDAGNLEEVRPPWRKGLARDIPQPL
jgi:hypothetical protein